MANKSETLDSIAQIKNSCRVCLQNPLKDKHKLENLIAGIYKYCTGLEIKKKDKFPQYICKECFSKLEEAHKIKKTSIESHFKLKSILEKLEGKEEETPIVKEEPIEPELECEIVEETNPLEDFEEKIQEKQIMKKPTVVAKRKIIQELPAEESPIAEKKPRYNQKAKKVHPIFFCDICLKNIQANKYFHIQEHKLNRSVKPVKECETCNKKFYLMADYANHSCQPVCKICDLKFPSIAGFQKHLGEFHFEGGIYRCVEPDCTEQEANPKDAYYHIKWHKNPIHLVCDICGMIYKNSLRFSNHKSNHQKVYAQVTCDYCGIDIKRKTNLVRHMKKIHLKVRYYCELCGKSYQEKMDLRNHQVKDHNVASPYSCDACSQPFQYLAQLNLHTEKYCKKTNLFGAGPSHRTPAPRRSKEEIEKNFRCTECNQYFNLRSNLIRHQRQVHMNIRSYTCCICDKGFSQKSGLEVHTRTHTGEKPFQCKFCFNRFADRSTLYKHLKIAHLDNNATENSRFMIKDELHYLGKN